MLSFADFKNKIKNATIFYSFPNYARKLQFYQSSGEHNL